MKPSALFISNKIYFDPNLREGGVKLCTQDYLRLIQELYDVHVFQVAYHISFLYRLRVKLGLNIYSDYQTSKYINELRIVIEKYRIKIVFLNLSNTAPFASLVKSLFGNRVKVILCSHGNESGDFLHEVTRFKKRIPFYRSIFSSFVLGRLLKKEAAFRHKNLDAVLTVSPVEESIEKWLGAKHVFIVPRTVYAVFIERNPVVGRVGFIGDLSHWPNFFGIDEICKALASASSFNQVQLRLVGTPEEVGRKLAERYSFVSYLGYMNEESLLKEAASWSFFLNPVFYYSRGVSTKLTKAFGWGIPVITTSIGCRGYVWKEEQPVYAETPAEMANAIQFCSTDSEKFPEVEFKLRKLVLSIPGIVENAQKLKEFISKLS
jgi:hypothetical protein